jgi:hypothetical protein
MDLEISLSEMSPNHHRAQQYTCNMYCNLTSANYQTECFPMWFLLFRFSVVILEKFGICRTCSTHLVQLGKGSVPGLCVHGYQPLGSVSAGTYLANWNYVQYHGFVKYPLRKCVYHSVKWLRCEVLTAVTFPVVFWVVMPRSLAGDYQQFTGMYHLHVQSWRGKWYLPL